MKSSNILFIKSETNPINNHSRNKFKMPAQKNIKDVVVREYIPREHIVVEGSSNDRFFVILKGNVEILQNNKSIRVLKDGDVFGIENHFLKRPYTTTAVSLTKSRIASYPALMLKEFIYDRPQLILQILESVLTQLEQTTQIAEANISFENVVDINEKIFHDGEVLIAEGTDGTDIFRLVESEHGLQVTRAGKEVGRITGTDEYFGEMSALLHEERSATVTSIGRSIVQIFNVDDLPAVLENYPQLSIKIVDALAKRLNEANKKIAAYHHPESQSDKN